MANNIVEEKDLENVSGGTFKLEEYYSKAEHIYAVELAKSFKERGGNLADFTLYMRTPEAIRKFGTYDPGYEHYIFLINWAWEFVNK